MSRQTRIGIALVIVALLAFGSFYCLSPQVCCSCICETASKEWCPGQRAQGPSLLGCERICDDQCRDRECYVTSSTKTDDGKCPGGLIPFL